jgi:hypothetical protein
VRAAREAAPATQKKRRMPLKAGEIIKLTGTYGWYLIAASESYLSEGTVKGSVSRLMALLDCKNRTQLALRVVQPPG